ncbi:MAG: hypothetical protein O2923_13000 [Verrucomicrobia bacterium]|nr:hypothetical protein [Verrucomicrobiota bacterium]MDA1088259.1 hypothetical protein [Verrucomicrobiota bacterium]
MDEDGQYLPNCLRYVDMNMVRAGVVEHPEQWQWCGYDELTGQRKRFTPYRVSEEEQSSIWRSKRAGALTVPILTL